MKTETTPEVFVESIKRPELGLGEIIEINYNTGEALISVGWSNGTKNQYWANELEFILSKKD